MDCLYSVANLIIILMQTQDYLYFCNNITLHNVCTVHWGVEGGGGGQDIISTLGEDIISTLGGGYHEYTGGMS